LFFLRMRVLALPPIAVFFAGIACGQTTISTVPSSVALNQQPGGSFQSTILEVSWTGATTLTVSVNTYGVGKWLSVSPLTLVNTPAPLQLYAGPAATALPTGVYS